MAKRLFEGAEHAAGYALYRPHYGAKIREVISAFMSVHKCSFDWLVDVACGSGQSLHQWSNDFKKCTGLDISAEQIMNAREAFPARGKNNVEFDVGQAECLPNHLKNVDLVTIAQAWHWVNPERFYMEADRVLKTPGVLAVYGYGVPSLPENAEANSIVRHYHDVTLGKYWDSHRRHIVNRYSEVSLPYKVAERHDLEHQWPVPLSHFVSYLGTWSAFWKYREEHPDNSLLSDVQKELAAAIGGDDGDPIVECVFPLFLNIGLKQ